RAGRIHPAGSPRDEEGDLAELEGNLSDHYHGVHHGRAHHGVLRGGRPGVQLWREVFDRGRRMSQTGTHPDAKWYIVHTYSNFEKKVKEEIQRQAKLQDLEEFVADRSE